MTTEILNLEASTPLEKIAAAKRAGLILPFTTADGSPAQLKTVTADIVNDEEGLILMTNWRNAAKHAFPAEFEASVEGTRIWATKALLNVPDRLLFWVFDRNEKRVGHVGLFRLSPDRSQIEIDNIVRGEIPANKGLIFHALVELLKWQRRFLHVPQSYLRVFSDNAEALRLYAKLNYSEIQRVPLKKVVSPGRVEWHEIVNEPYIPCQRYFLTLHQASPL